jgi:hypothetical protein
MLLLIPRLNSTKAQSNNQLITVTINSQPQMLSAEDLNSLIQIPVLANGGKLDSTNHTSLTESRSSTEETAAVEDSVELKSW